MDIRNKRVDQSEGNNRSNHGKKTSYQLVGASWNSHQAQAHTANTGMIEHDQNPETKNRRLP